MLSDQCSVFSIQCSALGARCSVLDSKCSVLGAQYCILSIHCSALGTHYSIVNAQYSVLTAQCSLFFTHFSVVLSFQCPVPSSRRSEPLLNNACSELSHLYSGLKILFTAHFAQFHCSLLTTTSMQTMDETVCDETSKLI